MLPYLPLPHCPRIPTYLPILSSISTLASYLLTQPKSLPLLHTYIYSPYYTTSTSTSTSTTIYPTYTHTHILTCIHTRSLSISTLPCYLHSKVFRHVYHTYIHSFALLQYYYYYQPYLLHACIHTCMHAYQVTPCLTRHPTYYQHNPPIGTPRVLLLASTLLYM
jgi:hypothetical protein